jgi:hypothetical protein
MLPLRLLFLTYIPTYPAPLSPLRRSFPHLTAMGAETPSVRVTIFNAAFLKALSALFGREGAKVIAKVAKHQPAAHMKICALLVPREMKVERSGGVSDLI